MFERTVMKQGRWPSVSELVVIKVLLWGVWEAVLGQWGARGKSQSYPALRAPEDYCKLNWTSTVSAVGVLRPVDEGTLPASFGLLVLMSGMIVAVYMVQCFVKRSSNPWEYLGWPGKHSTPKQDALSKSPEIEQFSEPPVVVQQETSANDTLAVSALDGILRFPLESRSTADKPTVAGVADDTKLFQEEDRASTYSVSNLAFSGAIVTIDIPPSPIQRPDEDDIDHLSDLLQKW